MKRNHPGPLACFGQFFILSGAPFMSLIASNDEIVVGDRNDWHGTGWVNDPVAVACVTAEWAARGMPVTLSDAAPRLVAEAQGTEEPVFFWLNEDKVLGARLATWNQKSVGSCVGFGNGRCAQDLMLAEIAGGEPEQWAGAEVAPEVVYGGSRVEVGGGRISGDGSVGAWAADWLMKWGVVPRGVYGALDLRAYDETTCRALGRNGIPAELETLARAHPVRAAALCATGEEGWAAIGGYKPIAVCSNRGFAMKRNPDGTCSPAGVWNHCMGLRGRFVEPRQRKRRFVLGNSWGDYLGSSNRTIEYVAADGSVKSLELPEGHFAVEFDVVHGMLAQRDSFALAGLTGWAKTVVDYTP